MKFLKNLSRERVGEVSILSSTFLWGLFPILAILSYSGLQPITSLAWTTLFSLFFFLIVIIVRKSWRAVSDKETILALLGIALINGILFYSFYYIGLQYTSAGNSAIIGTAEILFSFLFFNVWRKEYIRRAHILGAVLMVVSVVIMLSPNISQFQIGDFWILGAVIIVPFGNHLQKKIRSKVSSEQILFIRTLIATPFLFLLAYLLGESIILPMGNTWFIILLNGLVLFGFTKILWIESIFRIGVTKSISLASVSPIFTLIFAFIFLKDAPTYIQLIAIPFSILGVYFLTREKKNT